MSVIGDVPVDQPLVESHPELTETRAVDRNLDPRLLRWGATPLLGGMDLLAAAVAVAVIQLPAALAVSLGAAFIVTNYLGGLYRPRLTLSSLDDSPGLVGRAFIASAAVLAVAALAQSGQSNVRILAAGACYSGLVIAGRSVAYAAVRAVRRRGDIAHRTLVLGAGRVGASIVSLLIEHPEYGLAPLGFLDSDPFLDEVERPVPLLGGFENLAETIHKLDVREIIIAFGAQPEAEMIDILRTCDRMNCEIFFVPRLFEMHGGMGDGVDSVWGLPLVRMRRAAFRSPSWRVKRLFDIMGAAVALVAVAPALLALAVAVRMTGRDVLFRQERVGLDGRPFKLLKFRTLRPVNETEAETLWSIAADDRVSSVGRFLRRTSLDELPQLWNVLVGDMTLVGPRPERPYFVDEFARSLPRYVHRHRVPAGLTGWAQVHGLRGDTSIAERARFDNYYIENWSLWLDVKILLRTLASFCRGAR